MVGKPLDYPLSLSIPEVRERFLTILGDFRVRAVPLDVRVTGEEELPGDIVSQRVEYQVEAGERVPAFHLFHRGLRADAPGVLSIHAHGGDDIFPVGKAFHCRPDPSDPAQYSYRAALEGFRVLAPDALCFGERRKDWGYAVNFFDETCAHSELTSLGKSLVWKSVWDNTRAIEVLESLGAPRVGAMGWSGGSTQAYILASANEKVRAVACFFSFMTLRHEFYQYRLTHCLYHFIPGMMKAGIDWDQVVSLIPPRKIFLGWGALDEGTPEPMYRAFVQAVERRCEAEGLGKCCFVHEEPRRGHEITPAMLDAAMAFMHDTLKHG